MFSFKKAAFQLDESQLLSALALVCGQGEWGAVMPNILPLSRDGGVEGRGNGLAVKATQRGL